MSASPRLAPEQLESPTPAPAVAYNSATLGEPMGEAAAMTGGYKQWAGKVVDGQFALKKFLGESDHSAVFLTERSGKDPQKVVIKIVPAFGEEAGGQLFRWRLAAKVPHPHLVRLFETGRATVGDTSVVYAVMEYADEDLAQILPQRALTPAEARQTFQPILQALAYIHSKGFVHGSLKPSNVMAVGETVKISSDSLRTVGESERNPGVVPARNLYDAPETDGGTISTAADVWSLGMTLVEALTQRLPDWDRTQSREPAVPHSIASSFRDVALNSLRLDPLQRWKLPQIAARLVSASAPIELATAEKKRLPKWLYLVPIAAAILVIALLAGPKLRNSPVPVQSQPQASEASGGTPTDAAIPPKPTPGRSGNAQARQLAPTPPATHLKAPPEDHASSAPAATAIPGSVLRRVMPNVSRSALNTIQGHVRVAVKVNVDASGNVARAGLSSPGPSKYFARKALEAAQEWKFAPAQVNGQPAPSEWALRFVFGRSSTDVSSARTAPR